MIKKALGKYIFLQPRKTLEKVISGLLKSKSDKYIYIYIFSMFGGFSKQQDGLLGIYLAN